jgi:uncharacterized protein
MNHLSHSTSPYLLQHAQNPVDWYPWGEEALRRAHSENKPIFLSIGYAACHWCHVMAHESFENQETAALMNENFVCIKVDREERPDLDTIYMQATTALTGSGGWPMSVFLMPDLRPFYAGTYFPPTRRYNLPSFGELLVSLAKAWREEPEEILRVSEEIVQQIRGSEKSGLTSQRSISKEDLSKINATLLDAYDWMDGGWGTAPKFPQPMAIDFLLNQTGLDKARREEMIRAPLHALKSMARGGMYDVLGGGFARYSTDNSWHIPHFEKMLYDNAQLALAYLHAWQITHEPFFERIVVETLDFVIRELTHPEGGFYSSLDADSEGEEGKYYAWTKDEIRAALPDNSDYEFMVAAYGIVEKGNWEDRTILQRALDDGSLAALIKLDLHQVYLRLARCHAKLRSVRSTRVRPATDDKILTAWNGLMLSAFAEAARFLGNEEKANQYLELATRNAGFLLANLRPDDKLRRSWRNGTTTEEVFLEDYSALILGLLDLYQTDFNNRWFVSAQELAEEMIQQFSDPEGGFFDTPKGGEMLFVRPKDIQDNATPSGNAMACAALLKLAAFTDRGDFRDLGEAGLGLIAESAPRYPLAYARWLSAANFALADGRQVAVLYPGTPGTASSFLDVIRREYRPNDVVAMSVYPPPQGGPALLIERPLQDGQVTVYVCEHFVCKQPVNLAADLQELL